MLVHGLCPVFQIGYIHLNGDGQKYQTEVRDLQRRGPVSGR